jgi:subtilase family serine protease
MKTMLALSWHKRIWVCGLIAASAIAANSAGAQSVAPRIRSEIGSSEPATLKGSLHPQAQPQFDAGRMPSNNKLNGVSIVFGRTAAQEADLKALIAAQQNSASPLYHQWLTPEQFAARFGMAESDLNKVEAWLEQQGFTIDSVARSRNVIRFSGTVRQVEQAFSTQMHYYKAAGVQHFAPSTELSVPAAMAPVVLAVRNLSDFRPKSQVILRKNVSARPGFTSSQTGTVYFSPGDIETAYNILPAFSSGYTGSGQTIVIVGQSAIVTSDIENFQNAAGLPVKDPTLMLMPGTGSSEINPGGSAAGDELESDLDNEWSGAIAKGATIDFVYTGSNTNYGAFDALEYAVTEQIGTIISSSYGDCETDLGSANAAALDSILAEAPAQGQTIVSASGDNGSTSCYGYSNLTTAQQEALAVNYPASSAYVTGVGGTAISLANSAYLKAGDGYWEAQSSSADEISSALQYIPEVVWNDDTISEASSSPGLGAGGGGASVFFTKPSWQTGVPGIPSGNVRYVPDVSLYSSPSYPGYLYCSSDVSTGITGSCSNGFRDTNDQYLTIAGGTSFAAPIFAGMVAILNQKAGYTSGQGLVNPELYKLASNSTTYASAFHDITSGSNACTGGSTYCSSGGESGFSATTGYDEATGLGSVNFGNLVTAWADNTGVSLIGTSTSVTPTSTAPLINVSDNFTISVTSDTGSTTPTGTVDISVDGGTAVTETLTSNGTYVFTTSFSSAGTHSVLVHYAGDTTHAASTGSASVNVAGTTTPGKITLSAAPSTLSVSRGNSGAETLTVTPSNGYTGTVMLTFDSSNDSALTNLCYDFTTTTSSGDGSVAITGTAAVTTQLTFDTNASDCMTSSAQKHIGPALHRMGGVKTATSNGPNPVPLTVALGGLLLAGFLGKSSRKFHTIAGLIALLAVGLAVSACGGGNSSSTPSDPPKGTYTITVTGTDSVTSTITSQTQFTFVID